MLPLPAVLAAALLSAAAAPAPLDQITSLLGQKKWDDAFALLSQIPVPLPEPAASDAALALSRGAADCRAADPILALGFASLAARLAPNNADVQVGYAEALLAADQRGEAAAVLDRVIAQKPASQAPRAWLARGELAAREGDYALAAQQLEPLASVPEMKARVAPLLALSRAELKAEGGRRKQLAEMRAQEAKLQAWRPPPPAQAPVRPEPSDDPAPPPGTTIASFPSEISRGGQQMFTASGLRVGATYALRARGRCWHEDRIVWMGDRQSPVRVPSQETAIFGIDFRVEINGAPSRQLWVDQGSTNEETRVSFVADAPEVHFRVWDEGSMARDVLCSLSGFRVTAE